MKKAVQITTTITLTIVSFFIGFQRGVVIGDYNRPPGVTTAPLMQELWEAIVKSIEYDEAIGEVIREEIALGNEKGVLYLKDAFDNFEPMVFCHPFIIIKRKDNMAYRVFMNSDVSVHVFDNITVPTLDFTVRKNHSNIFYYDYIFTTPPRTTKKTKVADFIALIRTDKENNRMSTVVSVSNAEKNESFIYHDLDVNGIFESIVHMNSLIFNDTRNMTPYTLTEFAKEFENVKADESLPNDNSKRKNKALEASQDGDYNSIEN